MTYGMMQRLRQGWERLSIYLPVLLMGLLALGSWWLVRNAPAPLPTLPQQAPAHEPDYFMRDFSIKHFDAAGKLTSELRGTLLRHFVDTDTLEIDQPRIRSITPAGRVTTARAQRAVSNADGSEVQFFGDAVIVREPVTQPGKAPLPQLEFRGEFLHAWVNDERVRSNQPVTLVRGNDQFTADSMDYDNLDQILNLHGRVQGTLRNAAAPR